MGFKCPPLKMSDLEAGIDHWKWKDDFHNGFYAKLKGIHGVDGKRMFGPEWWADMREHLDAWKATRNPPPGIKIDEEARKRFSKLRKAWQLANGLSGIAGRSASWDVCGRFFDIAAEIKPVKNGSAVFPSKLCHFCAPHIYPVVDGEMMGGCQNYREFWECARRRWQATPKDEREKMEGELRKRIKKSGTRLVPGYPFACKIIELCHIGEYKKGA